MAKAKRVHIQPAQTSKGQQSVFYRETFEQGGYKIRVFIKSDAYDFQSCARVEVWHPQDLCWNELATIHYGQMKTQPKLVYLPADRGLDKSHFQADRDELVRQAELILGL